MPLFTSSREKKLWLYAMLVLIAIVSTLMLGHPLQEMLKDQNVQAVFFLLAMVLVGTTILIHGLTVRPSKTEIATWVGLTAIYITFILRLGIPERSHLIEYSVLAIFIHQALIERRSPKAQSLSLGIVAFIVTTLIGFIDESIQLYLPNRVFDPNDILFNCLAALIAIGGSIILQWVRRKFPSDTH